MVTKHSQRYRRNDRYSASNDDIARAIIVAQLHRMCFFINAYGVLRPRPETRFYFTLMRGENGRFLPAHRKSSRPISQNHSDCRDSEANGSLDTLASYFWGDNMMELGRVTATSATLVGCESAPAGLCASTANRARVSLPVSCLVTPLHLALRMTSTFTTGIWGTAPPPIG